MQGEVKFFKPAAAYGFIRPDDGGPDVFCHMKQVNDRCRFAALAIGQRVSFEIGMSARDSNRTCATDVTLLAPIISPPRESDDADDAGDAHTAHMELAQTTFMRR